MKICTVKAYAVLSNENELLAVYLDKVQAEMQLLYFQHRTPRIIELKGDVYDTV
jgi:hypothetical protein